MKHADVIAAWNAQSDFMNDWSNLSEEEKVEFALSLAGKVEKQEPVAWVIVENGKCVATRSANFSHITDGQYRLYTSPQPCPECEKLKAERDELAEELRLSKLNAGNWHKQFMVAMAERDELAAQVEKMREFLQFLWRDAPLNEYTFGRLEEILALPDIATGIINKVRAETLRKAAELVVVTHDEILPIMAAYMGSLGTTSAWERTCIASDKLREALAADMEAGRCQVY